MGHLIIGCAEGLTSAEAARIAYGWVMLFAGLAIAATLLWVTFHAWTDPIDGPGEDCDSDGGGMRREAQPGEP